MKVMIIDDEELAIEVLERMLSKIEGIQIVGKYSDPTQAMEEIDETDADAIFLDLEMGAVHGLQIAEELNSRGCPVEIVFVTGYSQFAVEAFDLNAADYLLKPVSPERLIKTIDRLKIRLAMRELERKAAASAGIPLYIHVMGTFWVSSGKKTLQIKWRTKKVKELFLYLWHQEEKPVHSSRIIDELWPDTPADRGTTLLHTTVYQLRKTLKEIGCGAAVQYANKQYSLNPSPPGDARELEAKMRDQSLSEDQVRKMLLLYAGDYLEEEDYAWPVYEQQRLQKDFLLVLERFLHSVIKSSPREPIIEACLIKMLQIDDCNEEYCFMLMKYYQGMGDRRKFVEVYQEYGKRIKEELGLSISLKMIELYRSYIRA